MHVVVVIEEDVAERTRAFNAARCTRVQSRIRRLNYVGAEPRRLATLNSWVLVAYQVD